MFVVTVPKPRPAKLQWATHADTKVEISPALPATVTLKPSRAMRILPPRCNNDVCCVYQAAMASTSEVRYTRESGRTGSAAQ